MKIATIVARFLFGLPILFFGLSGFFVVMPDPAGFLEQNPGMSPKAVALLLSMWDSQFLMPSICVAHAISGLLVIINRFVPLALAIHMPVSVQMVLFHLFLDLQTSPIAFLVFALNVFLVIQYRQAFMPLFAAKTDLDFSKT